MARRNTEEKNRSSKRWLMVGVYPVALLVLFFGVLFFDWMAEASESDPQEIEIFSDRDVDDILERFGIDDIEDIVVSQVDDIDDIEDIDDTDDIDQLISDITDIESEDIDDVSDEEDSEEIEDVEEPEDDEQFDGYYYYSVLSDADKSLYTQLSNVISNPDKRAAVKFASNTEAERIYCIVKGDHPEYFYVDGYNYQSDLNGGISVTPSFVYDTGEIISKRAMNEAVANEILDSMPSGLSDYEIIKYCYEWIVDNTVYVMGCEDNQEMTSVFLNHESVCAGYTRAMQYLLQRCGMQAMYVGGYASGRHAWLIVQVEGQYYNLDVTWADNDNPDVPHPDYAYLLLSTEKMSRTHTANTDIYPVPNCTAMDSNFYIQENLYVNSLDDGTLQEIFDKSKLEYNGTVHIMASDAGIYRALINYLLKEGNVYRFYYGDREQHNINYFNNDDLYTLMFYK